MKIPFDYEKYCTGKYDVQTISGMLVNGLTKFETTKEFCLYGVLENHVDSWTIEGKYEDINILSDNDLVLIEKSIKIFKNIYKNDVRYYFMGNDTYHSFHEAEIKGINYAQEVRVKEKRKFTYIKTIEIIDQP